MLRQRGLRGRFPRAVSAPRGELAPAEMFFVSPANPAVRIPLPCLMVGWEVRGGRLPRSRAARGGEHQQHCRLQREAVSTERRYGVVVIAMGAS